MERNQLFVHIEHFWDLLFWLMKHGTNTLHVAFYVSVYIGQIIIYRHSVALQDCARLCF